MSINFSGIPGKSYIGKLLRTILKLIPPQSIVPILQGRLKGKKWVVGSGVNGYWLGSFELKKQRVFIEHVKEGMVIFDVGAHVGYYSLLASQLVGEKGYIVAFEPLPRNLYYFKKHIDINSIRNIRIIDAAILDACGEAYFIEGEDSSTGHINPDGPLKVKTITLDSIVSSGDISTPNLIKIDVEGAEVQVLHGAYHTLANYHPMIMLATHGSYQQLECSNFLHELGYSLLPIDNQQVECVDEILARYEA